jgi:uridine kinase
MVNGSDFRVTVTPRSANPPTLAAAFRTLCHYRLFWFAGAFKLVLGSLVASTYLRDLFLPFLNYFVESHFSDPWAHFAQLGRIRAFPYPPVMLYVMSLPRALFSPLLPSGMDTVTWGHLLVARIPLLACDLLIALVLVRWLPGRADRIVKYYWCSPIAIYVSYWHGQLDVVPTALFLLSLYLLRGNRHYAAMSVFGLALASKTHLLIALPFLLTYLYQESGARKTARSALLALAVYVMATLPYLFRPGFGQMVFATQEQARLFALQVAIGPGMWLMVAPAAILLLWFRFLWYRHRNWDLLMLYLGILFSVFVLLAPPAPGYVFWSLPFLVHFVCRGRKSDFLPLLSYNVVYLVFFWTGNGSDLFDAWRVVAPAIANLSNPSQLLGSINPNAVILLQKCSFTVMEVCLAGVILFMYISGVRRSDVFRMRTSPLMIGIAGDSGAGKDTFVQLIRSFLERERVTVVSGDDYHRWPRGHEMWRGLTHLDVRANDLQRQSSDAIMFSLGHPVLKGTYDHSTGQFTEERSVDCNDVLVFQGLHALATEKMRSLYDLAVFVEPDEDLRRLWKVRRDQSERGHSLAGVLKSLEDRSKDRELYILPQKEFADVIVRWYSLEPISLENTATEPVLGLDITTTGAFDLAEIARMLPAAGLTMDYNPAFDGDRQMLSIRGTITARQLGELADQLLPDSLRMLRVSNFVPGLPGCLQLVFAVCLNQKLSWKQSQIALGAAAYVRS